ncbi:MAG: hypothetical protein V1897_12720 [Pseudomonadota bacterium]
MENARFHILEWQVLDGTEFFSLLTDPTRENPTPIPYRAWVLSDPTIVSNPTDELPRIFFDPWVRIGLKSLADFLRGTNLNLYELYDLVTQPEYGFEYEDIFVKPVSLGKRLFKSSRGPRIEVWSFHEDIPSLRVGTAFETSRRDGLQRMF